MPITPQGDDIDTCTYIYLDHCCTDAVCNTSLMPLPTATSMATVTGKTANYVHVHAYVPSTTSHGVH